MCVHAFSECLLLMINNFQDLHARFFIGSINTDEGG